MENITRTFVEGLEKAIQDDGHDAASEGWTIPKICSEIIKSAVWFELRPIRGKLNPPSINHITSNKE